MGLKVLLFVFLLPSIFFSGVFAHSWVSCTNYDLSNGNDASVYNPSKCSGFGRGWGKDCERTNNQFGLDCGYNHGGANPVCPYNLNANYSSGYTAQSPMAVYNPGQTVCLAWPAKNHVSASCNNPDIPDHGTKIYMSSANPTSDPSNLSNLPSSPYTLIKDLGTNTEADGMVGFQNCPLFCSDPDKCLCTGCFTLPTTLQRGAVYSFFWVWAFNSDSDTYTSCWEARISGTASPVSNPAITTAQAKSTSITSAKYSNPSPTSSPTSNPTSTSTSSCEDETYCEKVCGDNGIFSCQCEDGDWSVECHTGSASSLFAAQAGHLMR